MQQQQQSAKGGGNANDDATRPPPVEGKCCLWMPQKRRYCRGSVHKGSTYCGAHLALDVAHAGTWAPGDERVPCPINPNHSVAAKDVKHHVTVCPDLRNVPTAMPYYVRGCNGGRLLNAASTTATENGPDTAAAAMAVGTAENMQMDKRASTTRHFKHLDTDGLTRLIRLIESVYAVEVEPFLTTLPTAPSPADDDVAAAVLLTGSNTATPYAARQAPQLSALCRTMAVCGLIPPSPSPSSSSSADTASFPACGAEPLWRRRPITVELAAGKGAFALAIAEAWAEYGRRQAQQGGPASSAGDAPFAAPRLVVADRGGFRRKADGRVARQQQQQEAEAAYSTLGGEQQSSSLGVPLYRPFTRLRIDLRDLELDTVADVITPPAASAAALAPAQVVGSPTPSCVIGVGKHLCGNCTDYGITAVARSVLRGQRVDAGAIFIAPCCHHLAERSNMTRSVVAPPAQSDDRSAAASATLARLLDDAGAPLGGDAFDLIASLSSWAVSGHRGFDGDAAPSTTSVDGEAHYVPQTQDSAAASGIAPRTKTAVGRKAKRIVDWLRVLTLRALGFDAYYIADVVPVEVSPENGVIFAQRRRT